MRGYVARTSNRSGYLRGLDPVTEKERGSSHPAGTDREERERLAARLAGELTDNSTPATMTAPAPTTRTFHTVTRVP